ncbi:MAG: ArnT family glycosyltransferase, partial [Acidimicrobiia bacterium]
MVTGFLALSIAYNVTVPLYEAPDEIAHGRYITSLAEYNKLPEFDVPADYESWQPPLYYAVGAGTLKLFGLGPLPELPENPNRQQISGHLHTIDESFPYSEPVLAVHVLRGISGLFGAGAIVFIYLSSMLLLPERKLLALSAAATAGTVPQFAFISSSVSNDSASVFFAAATIYFALRYMKDTRDAWLVMAAIALSLGALTKGTTVIAGAVPLGVLLFSALQWRQKVRHLVILGALPLFIAGWFYARSVLLWGAVYPEHLFWTLSPKDIWDPIYRLYFPGILRHTYWYAGGNLGVSMSPTVYDLLDVVSALSLAGVIVTVIYAKLLAIQRQALVLLAILPVLATIGIVYFSVTVEWQPQGRYLFVAHPALAILLPLGLAALFARNRDEDHPISAALPALLLAINVYI